MKETYKIVIGGDILPSGKNISLFKEGNANELFGEDICQLFSSADFSIVNLEGPLTDYDEKQEKAGPVIKAPKTCVHGLKALGIKAFSLANNHITDYGQTGYEDTINALENCGIQHVGSGTIIKGVKTNIQILLGTIRVCIYAVSEKFFNSPEKYTIGANLYDEYLVCNEIKRLRTMCDYLIVMYHGGAEYLQYPTPRVRTRCHRMADSGADFIVTQHTHCIGCEEYYGTSYILHGQGNFLFARQKMFPNLTKEGLLIELLFHDNNVEIIKHHVRISNDIIRRDNNWDEAGFLKRSSEISNEEMIIQKYRELKVGEIMNKFLLAAQGRTLISRVCLRLFPNIYKKNIYKRYTRNQILLNLCVIDQDRRNEDMLSVWEYLLDYSKK